MKRIIDISEEDYKRFISYKSNKYAPTIHEVDTLMLAVADSTPLTECEADDCRSLIDMKEMLERKADALDGQMLDACAVYIGLYFEIANDLPSVYPKSEAEESVSRKRPPNVWCCGCKEYDKEKHCCHRYSKVIRDTLNENINSVLEDIKAEIMQKKAYRGDPSESYGMELAVEIIDKHISGKENG